METIEQFENEFNVLLKIAKEKLNINDYDSLITELKDTIDIEFYDTK